MPGRIEIDDVRPVVSCGRYPAKAVVGEMVPVRATVWREGHEAVAATLVVRYLGRGYPRLAGTADRMMTAGSAATGGSQRVKPILIPMVPGSTPDVFHGEFTPDSVGLWTFRVDGWGDPIGTWRHSITAKLDAGQSESELSNDLLTGAKLFERAAMGLPRKLRDPLLEAAAALRTPGDPLTRVEPASTGEVTELLEQYPLRELLTRGEVYGVWVDRPLARFSSWYEMFPRSIGGWDAKGRPVDGTFATAAEALPRIAKMGFDVVYLPPIHPIGTVHRKGRNNSEKVARGDVGSPWAIGSKEGGHDAVHRGLGNIDDFDTFVAAAREQGLEVALDLALQCAPDHPWVTEHPDWFTVLPDGTIAYAENPPKKYQDIYPLNFDVDPDGLYQEVLRVVRHWVDHGVKVFRVDNPHTKPPDFWEWLIEQIKTADPDVVLLSEAFTRPARLYGLAKLGFTQSYTYFTWRTSKWELSEFGQEIAEHADYARPNLFVNTPDILHESLQRGGPGMFAIRAVLAATMSTSWGVYSGYELFEHRPVREGSEEYLDSEKYQLRYWSLDRPDSLRSLIARMNSIRRDNAALHSDTSLRFCALDNEQLIGYLKSDASSDNVIIVVVNLDPHHVQSGWIELDLARLGLDESTPYQVHDLLSDQRYPWRGRRNYVMLDPGRMPAHVLKLRRYLRTEHDFDYFL